MPEHPALDPLWAPLARAIGDRVQHSGYPWVWAELADEIGTVTAPTPDDGPPPDPRHPERYVLVQWPVQPGRAVPSRDWERLDLITAAGARP